MKLARHEALLLTLVLVLATGARGLYRAELVGQPDFAHPALDAGFNDLWARSLVMPDYEPPAEASAAAVAAREGRRPEEVILDWMLEKDGKQFLFAPLANYADANFDAIREMLVHPRTMIGLSDGGAHCGLICDCSMPTYLLTHWARDRSRGEGIPLEAVVKLQTKDTAEVYGFGDRGVIAPGMKADINVIDFDGLTLHAPEMVHDLPAGGRRLIQRVDGYRATICSGEVIFENGEPTGAMPGKLVRGPQPNPGVA